jgi:hypothetical protein
MKFYIGFGVLFGAMMSMGCATTMPRTAEPVGTTSLSSADLLPLSGGMMISENPYIEAAKPAPLPTDDPWAPEAPATPPTQTWGASLSMAVDDTL